jgi:hypothetical protein
VIEKAIYAYFTLMGAYVIATHAKKVMADGQKLGKFWMISLAPQVIAGLVLDFLFNVVIGTIIFEELPKLREKELMFSSRVQRHVRESDGKRKERALWWAKQLNLWDPTHIKM